MKKYIVSYNLVGAVVENHELWASSLHNAKQMTIGWLQFYLKRKLPEAVIVSAVLA